MVLRLLHTADWQLGKPFTRFAGDIGALLREARFEAVRTLARLAREHRVDAVLVAGDLFDSNLVQRLTIQRALGAMREFPGPWLLLPGNHDAALTAGVWTRLAAEQPPETVRVLLEQVPVAIADGRAVVLPAPLRERHTADDLTAWMDGAASADGVLRIGLAHGAVAERLPAGSEAQNPIAAARARLARLDYLALGDWHGTMEIAARTWYAGTPEPDGFRAGEQGRALLVELDGPGAAPQVRQLAVGRYRWRQASLDCTGLAAGLETPEAALRRSLGDLDDARHQLVALALVGCAGLAHRADLAVAVERLRGELAWLEVEDAALRDEPSAADHLLLEGTGSVGEAASRLRAHAESGNEDEAAVARLALRLLHAEAGALKAAAPR